MTLYSLFGVNGNGANGPSAVTAFAGNFMGGLIWKPTQNALWLNGYYIWCATTNGDTGPVKFALWQLANPTVNQVLVPGSTVTSGTLTRGQWNYVALPAPIGLSGSVPYVVAYGYVAVAGFSDTQNQFGLGQVYGNGLVQGPLTAYSDQGGGLPEPFTTNYPQGVFSSTLGSDPSVNMPVTGDIHSNFWVDVQVTNVPPAGASYKLWPSEPYAINYANDTATNFTLGTEFSLSQACTLNKIWFYSPSGVTQLPTEAAIYNIGSQSIVAGTDNAAPSWSGAAGSGWVSVSYTGVTLPAGTKMKAAVFNGAGVPAVWAGQTSVYWSTGPGGSDIVNGPLTAPSNADATTPGQSSYHTGTPIHYPDTNTGPFNYWVDLEVTPLPAAAVTGGGGTSMVKRSLLLADL